MNMKRFMMLMVALVTLADAGMAHAQGVSSARVIDLKGEAKFLKAGTTEWAPLAKDAVLSEGDAVKTAKDSQATLHLEGAAKTAEILVRPESEFVFETFRHDAGTKVENTMLDVHVGAVLVKAEKLVGDSKFEVKTPTSIVGIRGTTFEVQVSKA